MTITRRFLVVLALMFWQGGFMFYGAVTVPVIREQLSGRPERGVITQHVTQWMNLFGTLALMAMFADVLASRPPVLKRWRMVAWLGMALPHLAVVLLHRGMSRQMGSAAFLSSGIETFMAWHRAYLLLNTLQWLAGMCFLLLSLRAWRDQDHAASTQ
jgi:hypothetical protein